MEIKIGVTKRGNKVESNKVETQWGDIAAIHWGYYAIGRRQNDMAMIKLKIPFCTVTPIPCMKAPLVETSSSFLRVVGYPGTRGGVGQHLGAIMHLTEGIHSQGWDLKSTGYILRHRLDTERGLLFL